jgi:hypothetical protein
LIRSSHHQVAVNLGKSGTAVRTVGTEQISSGITELQSILAAVPPSPDLRTEASRLEWCCGACYRSFDQEWARLLHCRFTGHPIPSGREGSISQWWLCGHCCSPFTTEGARKQHCEDKGHPICGREDSVCSERRFQCCWCGRSFNQEMSRNQHCTALGHPIPKGRKAVDRRAQSAGAAAGAAPRARLADPASTRAYPEKARCAAAASMLEKETDCGLSEGPAPLLTAPAGPVLSPCGGISAAPEGDCGGGEAAPLPEKGTDCGVSEGPAPAGPVLSPCGGISAAPEGDCGGGEAAPACGGPRALAWRRAPDLDYSDLLRALAPWWTPGRACLRPRQAPAARGLAPAAPAPGQGGTGAHLWALMGQSARARRLLPCEIAAMCRTYPA